jgi:hypothetical protein
MVCPVMTRGEFGRKAVVCRVLNQRQLWGGTCRVRAVRTSDVGAVSGRFRIACRFSILTNSFERIMNEPCSQTTHSTTGPNSGLPKHRFWRRRSRSFVATAMPAFRHAPSLSRPAAR